MKTLDIFYNQIVEEAKKGRINCFFYYNIIFNTKVENKEYLADINEDLIIPTLDIKNKQEFDELLKKYVHKCLQFYDNKNYPEEILNDPLNKEKMIITLLFANATFEDFANPNEYLKRRINFLDNYIDFLNLGYSEILKTNIKIKIEKDKLNNETPYQFMVECGNSILPRLKFGISDNVAYIYAIQNKDEISKKINRALYKVGEGFDKTNDNYELYEEGNLNDVTPSFLLVANIFISYLKRIGINNIKICSFLPERWNAKLIANKLRKIDSEEQLKIQNNLTEKFIRTFLRLEHHYDNLKVLSYPMEDSSYLSMYNYNDVKCNNSLLSETSELCSKKR